MRPRITIENIGFSNAVAFQCGGGEDPDSNALNNLLTWASRNNVDWRTHRFFNSDITCFNSERFDAYDEDYDNSNGIDIEITEALMALNEDDEEDEIGGKLHGAAIYGFYTYYTYACLDIRTVETNTSPYNVVKSALNGTGHKIASDDTSKIFFEYNFVENNGVVQAEFCKYWVPLKTKIFGKK